jgi:hypothetical protein
MRGGFAHALHKLIEQFLSHGRPLAISAASRCNVALC